MQAACKIAPNIVDDHRDFFFFQFLLLAAVLFSKVLHALPLVCKSSDHVHAPQGALHLVKKTDSTTLATTERSTRKIEST